MVDASNKRVQFPRNTTAVNDDYVGPPGQVTVDSQRSELRLHNGKKRGGFRIPNLDQLKQLFVRADSELGQIKFASDLLGIMVRVADKTFRLRKLIPGDGIIIDNPNGQAGDITIRTAARLSGTLTFIDDLDAATESGQYATDRNANAMPAALAGVADGALWVIAGKNTSDEEFVIQRVISLTTSTNTVYTRRKAAGVWGSWA